MNAMDRPTTKTITRLVALAALLAASSVGCADFRITSPTAAVSSDSATVTAESTTQTTSSSTTTTALTEATASAAGVSLEYPGGWYLQQDGDSGLTLAEHQEDLTAEQPAGARIRLEAASADSADIAGLLAEVIPSGTDPAEVAEGFVVVGEPAALEVGGKQAASITVTEEISDSPTITRYVIVELEDATVLLFTLQAPKDQWDLKVAALSTILQSARFSSGAD